MQTCRGNHASNRLRRKEAGRAAPEKDADDLTPSDVDCLRLQVALQRFHITSLVELAVQCVGIEVAIRTLAHTPWEVHVERKRGDRWPAHLLDVLYLLAHLLDDDLHIDGAAGCFEVLRLRRERVRFAIELLHQEVEAAARRLAAIDNAADLNDVARKAIELFVDVEALQKDGQLLLE